MVAGFGTTFAGLPDLMRMLKQRTSSGIHPRIVAILLVSQFVWVYYGMLIGSRPVIFWNVIAIAINGLSVAAYLHFARTERREAKAA
jgi:MtN3 and saliva related transmembrane protein